MLQLITTDNLERSKANTGFDMVSAHTKCETCTRTWNIDYIWLYSSLCLLILGNERWADFLSNPALPFAQNEKYRYVFAFAMKLEPLAF